ncbi:adenosine deaminase [Candidatus Thioglobus sp.]|nr:adenosine deaminase [Candidatus Thioglobus sp.]
MQDQIQKLPKVELHSHLEGTINPKLFHEIAKRNNVDFDEDIFDEDGGYAWTDFPSFLNAYDSVSSCLKNAKDYRDIMYEYLKDCSSQNVIYAETFISPDHASDCGISYNDLIRGCAKGIDDAQLDFGIIGRIIVTCVRHLGPQKGVDVAQKMVDNPHPYVVGFGMGGDENSFKLIDFAPAFNIAAKANYPSTVHAGEICGAESVWDAINYLPVSRIGHGVRSVEDEHLLDVLKNRNIALEICPGSNLALSIYPSWESHPIKLIMSKGISVSLNSDDPPFFHTSVGQEYQGCADQLGFEIKHLKSISTMAIKSSFADPETKLNLLSKISQS